MHHVPVLRWHERHLVEDDVLVELVECRGGTRATGARNGCRGFVSVDSQRFAYHEGAIEKRGEGPRGGRIMNRRSEDEAVGRAGLFDEIVDGISAETAAAAGTVSAADAACERVVADPEDFRADPFGGEGACDFVERRAGAAVAVRAAVNHQDMHGVVGCVLR